MRKSLMFKRGILRFMERARCPYPAAGGPAIYGMASSQRRIPTASTNIPITI